MRALKPRVLSVPGNASERFRAFEPQAVDLARVGRAEDRPGRARRDRHVDRVARQAEHRDLLRLRVDRHDDQRVGVERPLLGPLVGADEQDVQPVLPVPLRAAPRSAAASRAAARGRAGVGVSLGLVPARRRVAGGPGCRSGCRRRCRRRRSGRRCSSASSWASAPVVGDDAVAAGDDQADRDAGRPATAGRAGATAARTGRRRTRRPR